MRFTQLGFVESKSWNLNIFNVFWTNQVHTWQSSRKVENRRRVTGAIRSLVNARNLQV